MARTNRQPSRSAATRRGAKKRQHTVQVYAFAVELKDKVQKAIQDQSPHVPSAAILAFSRLPLAEQIAAVKESRDLHLTGASQEV